MNNEDVLRFFDLYADDAFRLAYSYLGSRPDAKDVVQDVFVKLIRSDITIAKGKEKSYILTMTANRCRDFLKSADVVCNAPFEDAADVGSDMEFDEDDQETVSYDEFWSSFVDEEGNTVYQASWVGPEPILKIEPSDRARFANYSAMYDSENELVVC